MKTIINKFFNKIVYTKKNNKDKYNEFLTEIKKIYPTYPTIQFTNEEEYRKAVGKCLNMFEEIVGWYGS